MPSAETRNPEPWPIGSPDPLETHTLATAGDAAANNWSADIGPAAAGGSAGVGTMDDGRAGGASVELKGGVSTAGWIADDLPAGDGVAGDFRAVVAVDSWATAGADGRETIHPAPTRITTLTPISPQTHAGTPANSARCGLAGANVRSGGAYGPGIWPAIDPGACMAGGIV